MPCALTRQDDKRVLRALDPDLPFLASEAAIDIEILLSGGQEDLSKLRDLAERLKNSIDEKAEEGRHRSLMDQATLSVLGEAVAESRISPEWQRVEELISEAIDLSKLLSKENLKENEDDLKRARDFCVALSRAAASYRKSIQNWRPSHPFRR